MPISKEILSGSIQGRNIKVAATASPGTLIHTTGIESTVTDEIWVYAYNGHTASVVLTIQQGGTGTPDDDITVPIPAKSGLMLVVPGLVLKGTGTVGSEVRAYAGTADVVTVTGYVNRIS